MNTGKIIANLREKKGLTQDELANLLYVSRELVSKWETNTRRPSYDVVTKLSGIFGVMPENIVDYDENLLNEISACVPNECENIDINGFLQILQKPERLIFISRYYYGKSISQTARELHLSRSNVRKKLVLLTEKLTGYLRG